MNPLRTNNSVTFRPIIRLSFTRFIALIQNRWRKIAFFSSKEQREWRACTNKYRRCVDVDQCHKKRFFIRDFSEKCIHFVKPWIKENYTKRPTVVAVQKTEIWNIEVRKNLTKDSLSVLASTKCLLVLK